MIVGSESLNIALTHINHLLAHAQRTRSGPQLVLNFKQHKVRKSTYLIEVMLGTQPRCIRAIVLQRGSEQSDEYGKCSHRAQGTTRALRPMCLRTRYAVVAVRASSRREAKNRSRSSATAPAVA